MRENPVLPTGRRITVCLVAALLGLVQACSLLPKGKDPYLRARTVARTEVPVGLDVPRFDDVLVIPPMNDARGLSGQTVSITSPEPINTNADVDMIVIRRLGESRWVFVDMPPAMVWPKVVSYFDANGIGLVRSDPRRGEMETEWRLASGEDVDRIYESLIGQLPGREQQHQFRITVEPGVRSGSTEIHLRQREAAPGTFLMTPWPEQSVNGPVENKVLTEIAYYLGSVIQDGTMISAGALVGMSGGNERAEFVPDSERPLLKYRLNFDRAWATVGSALEGAEITVDDLDRSAAIYFVSVDQGGKRRGFFGRMLGGRKDDEESIDHFQIHLAANADEVHVTITDDGTQPADAGKAERLLKIIKEFST